MAVKQEEAATMNQSFGEIIRSCRRRKEKTLQDIAGALGVSVVYVSEVERGKRPPFVTERLTKLAKELGVEIEFLKNAALRERSFIEFDPKRTSPKQVEVLAALARGGFTDEQLDQILRITRDEDTVDGE
jgi:transcriptional regulator with XRE-family HTH domain